VTVRMKMVEALSGILDSVMVYNHESKIAMSRRTSQCPIQAQIQAVTDRMR
jgi:hypothetical protein